MERPVWSLQISSAESGTCRSLNAPLLFVFFVGPPSEEDCYADIEAAYDYLRKGLRVPAQNIVLYGRSLGSGPSCYLATKTALEAASSKQDGNSGPVGGLILHAPFMSVFRVVIDPGCTLPGDKFVNVDVLPMVQSPTILIHGTSDQIVPFHHSERLFEAVPREHRARPLYIEGMSHNNVHAQVRPMFVDRLTDYLRDHVWPNIVVRRRQVVSSSVLRKRIFKVVDSNRNGDEQLPDCEEVSDYDEASVDGDGRIAVMVQ